MDSPFDHSMKSDRDRAKEAALEARRQASRATSTLLRDLGQVRSVAEHSLHTEVAQVKTKLSFESIAHNFPKSVAVAGFAGGYLLSKALFGASYHEADLGQNARRLKSAARGSSLSSVAGLLRRSSGMVPNEISGQIRGIVVTLATQALTAFVAKHFDQAGKAHEKEEDDRSEVEAIEESSIHPRPQQALPPPLSSHH